MLHHLAGATIQVADLLNYNCHPQEDGCHPQEDGCHPQEDGCHPQKDGNKRMPTKKANMTTFA